MNGDASCFQGFYGDQGGLRYLFSSELSEEEIETLQKGQNLLKKLTECPQPKHNKSPRTCICLEPTCPQKGLICYLCLMESHKKHAMKVFTIEEVYEFLQKNSAALNENEQDQGKLLNKVIEEDKLPLLFEEFSSDLQGQIATLFSQMRSENANKVKAFHSISALDEVERLINERIGRISSWVSYNEDSSLKEIIKPKEAKANLMKKMDLVRESLQKEMEDFKVRMKAIIDVTLKSNMEMSLEKFKGKEEDKQPELKIKKSKQEVFEEEKIDKNISPIRPLLIGPAQKSLSLQHNVIKRLPHLPPRTESYWPITSAKKERIKFRPLRERVALLGFTQLKIMQFDGDLAKFKVTLFEAYREEIGQEQSPVLIKKQKSSILYTQEMQLKPEENEESNFMLFNKPIRLKSDCEYVLELSAVERYNCTCKYGLNNQEAPLENDVIQFLPAQDEIDDERFSPASDRPYEFTTNLTEGLFPSLIYDIVMADLQKFDFVCYE